MVYLKPHWSNCLACKYNDALSSNPTHNHIQLDANNWSVRPFNWHWKVVCTTSLLYFCSHNPLQTIGAATNQLDTTSLKNVLTQKIVPEIIDKCPERVLQVDFPSSGLTAKMGNLIKPAQARTAPNFRYEADPDQLHTLLMIDPDSPSRANHNLRNVVHYLINNIPGNDVKSGEIAVEYVPPCPFPEAGKHRIVYLLYKQPDGNRVEFEETVASNLLEGRGPLNLHVYASENNLGDPIAINFHLSDWDDYVQTIASNFG